MAFGVGQMAIEEIGFREIGYLGTYKRPMTEGALALHSQFFYKEQFHIYP